jgi:hypothetical protein
MTYEHSNGNGIVGSPHSNGFVAAGAEEVVTRLAEVDRPDGI